MRVQLASPAPMPCTLLTPVASAMPACQAGLSSLFLPMHSIRMQAPMPRTPSTPSSTLRGVEGLCRPASCPRLPSRQSCQPVFGSWPAFDQLLASRPRFSKPQPTPSLPSLPPHSLFRSLPASPSSGSAQWLQPVPETLARRRRQAGHDAWQGSHCDLPGPASALSRQPCAVWSVRLAVQPGQSRREGVAARFSPCRWHSARHRQPGVSLGRGKDRRGGPEGRAGFTGSMSPVCREAPPCDLRRKRLLLSHASLFAL